LGSSWALCQYCHNSEYDYVLHHTLIAILQTAIDDRQQILENKLLLRYIYLLVPTASCIKPMFTLTETNCLQAAVASALVVVVSSYGVAHSTHAN
jgi:hypothetical protein